MIHLIHPTGNVFVRALLQALEASGRNYQFYTTVAFSRTPVWCSILPGTLQREVARRIFEVPEHRLSVQPLREICRLLAPRLGAKRLTAHEVGRCSVDAVYQGLDRKVAAVLPTCVRTVGKGAVVYGYEDGCLEAFTAARMIGGRCVYDLPIAYWETSQTLLRQEAERLPDWEPTLLGNRDSSAKLERKSLELAAADVVLCPSLFVYRSLPKQVRDTKPCLIAEFGSPDVTGYERDLSPRRMLRVLFAGSMTQRKGLADVFEAMCLLDRPDIELVVMGSPMVPMAFYREKYPAFHYEPTRPHDEVLTLMRSCDVLVLPSIVEGRALVQQEAMSCGLPIIVTPNTGGEDLVVEGRTGFLVPIRSPAVLAERIAWCADHREEVTAMGAAARAHAAQYTWEAYAEKILSILHAE